MKLKFKNQSFQTDAVNAVVDLFCGQDKRQSTFSVDQGTNISFLQNDFGIGNALLIDNETLLANMHEVQKRNHLPQTSQVIVNSEYRISNEAKSDVSKDPNGSVQSFL